MRLRELEALERIAVSGKLNVVLGEKGLADVPPARKTRSGASLFRWFGRLAGRRRGILNGQDGWQSHQGLAEPPGVIYRPLSLRFPGGLYGAARRPGGDPGAVGP